MKKMYFLIIVFSIAFMKSQYVNAVSIDIEYLDILIGQFDLNEKLELQSDYGFEILSKRDKREHNHIKENSIFLNYNNSDIEILDSNDIIIDTIDSDGSMLIKGEFQREDVIQVRDDKYRDYISFNLKGNKIHIINHIKVNNYLYGVLPREVGSSFSYEALKAQAVVSKNYAFSNINKHKNDGFDLCSSTHCQVYGGYDSENETINRAIDDTLDVFMTYNGELISAPFHSNSGGYTQNSEDVWGGNLPYLRAVEDEFSLGTPYSTWDMEISPLEIKQKFSAKGINIGEILDLEIIEKSLSQRVSKCRVKGSLGEEILTGEKLRSILGNTNFKSASFDIEKTGDSQPSKYIYAISGNSSRPVELDLNDLYIQDSQNKDLSNRSSHKRVVSRNESRDLSNFVTKTSVFKFKGRGYGHGVGMSQWGANEMAKKGYTYKEILKHYYKDIDFLDTNKN